MKPPNTSVLHRTSTLILHFTILVAALWGISKSVTAYPTGSMSCSDIGDFAAAAVVGKQNGRSMEDALETVRKRTAGYPVERKNLTQICTINLYRAVGCASVRGRGQTVVHCGLRSAGRGLIASKAFS